MDSGRSPRQCTRLQLFAFAQHHGGGRRAANVSASLTVTGALLWDGVEWMGFDLTLASHSVLIINLGNDPFVYLDSLYCAANATILALTLRTAPF